MDMQNYSEDVGPREDVCLCFLGRVYPPARGPFASACERTFIFLVPVSLIARTLQARAAVKTTFALPETGTIHFVDLIDRISRSRVKVQKRD